jgi:UDP-N-acetylmuramate--alanine ligase
MILKDIDKERKSIVAKEDVVSWMENYVKTLNKEFGEVIITAGAGDIDTLVQPIKEVIQQA